MGTFFNCLCPIWMGPSCNRLHEFYSRSRWHCWKIVDNSLCNSWTVICTGSRTRVQIAFFLCIYNYVYLRFIFLHLLSLSHLRNSVFCMLRWVWALSGAVARSNCLFAIMFWLFAFKFICKMLFLQVTSFPSRVQSAGISRSRFEETWKHFIYLYFPPSRL